MRILLIDESGLLDSYYHDFRDNYVVDFVHDSIEGQYLFEVNEYDAVVMGPCIKPNEIPNINKNTVSVAVTYDNEDSNNRISLLNSGVDVCLKEPVHYPELDAQIKVLMKKARSISTDKISVGNVSLYPLQKCVYIGSRSIRLRRKEYEILQYLFFNINKIVSKEELLEHIWDDGLCVFSNTVEVQIRNLRLKLKKYKVYNLVQTVKGFGYLIKKSDL